MKPQKSKHNAPALRSTQLTVGNMTLDELKAQHKERVETNRRVEELKLSLLRITEHNTDQVVRLIRRWLNS